MVLSILFESSSAFCSEDLKYLTKNRNSFLAAWNTILFLNIRFLLVYLIIASIFFIKL